MRAFGRPACRLANVHESNRRGTTAGLLRKQGLLICAGNGQRALCLCACAKVVELGAAQVTKTPDVAIAASALDRGHVKPHRVFTRANQDGLRWLLQVHPSEKAT